jgi:hypothetical protein
MGSAYYLSLDETRGDESTHPKILALQNLNLRRTKLRGWRDELRKKFRNTICFFMFHKTVQLAAQTQIRLAEW